jgi:hypothetical protein
MIDIEVVGNQFTGIHNDYLYLLDDKTVKRVVTKRLPNNSFRGYNEKEESN